MGRSLPSQKYLSSRGGSYNCSFEEVVLQGLAPDGGLFLPEEIPQIPDSWSDSWINWSFQELAFNIFSLYISEDEVPSSDLKEIIRKSYASFRSPDVTPLTKLDAQKGLYSLELFGGPTYAFKDVALQFLGFLYEFFLTRKNEGKSGRERDHLTVVAATSGDTGSAAIYGLRNKKDLSIIVTFPKGRISPIQEAQMTSVLDDNVHNVEVDGTFDDCQNMVKALFADTDIQGTHRIAAVNSISFARILAQITYYFHSYASLVKSGGIKMGTAVRYSVPTGNFGDVLAGYFAKRMGLPIQRLIVATNENDILHRFWQSGWYEKKPVHSTAHAASQGGGFPEDGVLADSDDVKGTLSPAMDITLSSNFERLLWFLSYEIHKSQSAISISQKRAQAGEDVKAWLQDLKAKGGFGVGDKMLQAARVDFESERVSDPETLEGISRIYHETQQASNSSNASKTQSNGLMNGKSQTPSSSPSQTFSPLSPLQNGGYILDPHSAIGVVAALRSLSHLNPDSNSTTQPSIQTPTIALATAHPAKFSRAVKEALRDVPNFRFEDVLPDDFRGLENLPRRKTLVKRQDGIEGMRKLIRERVPYASASASGK